MLLNTPTKSPQTHTNLQHRHFPGCGTYPTECKRTAVRSQLCQYRVQLSGKLIAYATYKRATIWRIVASARAGVSFECRRTGRWWLQLRGVTVPGIELYVAFIETDASERRGTIISSSACATRELRAPAACYPSAFLFSFRRIFGIEKKELGDCQLWQLRMCPVTCRRMDFTAACSGSCRYSTSQKDCIQMIDSDFLPARLPCDNLTFTQPRDIVPIPPSAASVRLDLPPPTPSITRRCKLPPLSPPPSSIQKTPLSPPPPTAELLA